MSTTYDNRENLEMPEIIVPGSERELGNRISQMLALYKDRKSASERAGKSVDQLLAYVKGTSAPPWTVLVRLAQGVGVSLEWLATGAEPMLSASAGPETEGGLLTTFRSPQDLGDDFVLLPRYEVRAAAGAGAVVHSEQVVDHLAFKAAWVRHTLRRSPTNLILIEAQGDSMEPTISDGDLLLVDTSENKIRDYAIYVISFNGDLLVKRVQRKMSGDLVISSDNDRYKPDLVNAPLADQLRVVGQVVWHGGVV